MTRILVLVTIAAGLSACASNGGPRRVSELERLRTDCEARGGILTPTGRLTGYDARDNVCKLQGPASRIDGPRG